MRCVRCFSHPHMETVGSCCYFRDPGKVSRLLKTSCRGGGCRMGVVPLVYKASASGHRLMCWPSPAPRRCPIPGAGSAPDVSWPALLPGWRGGMGSACQVLPCCSRDPPWLLPPRQPLAPLTPRAREPRARQLRELQAAKKTFLAGIV